MQGQLIRITDEYLKAPMARSIEGAFFDHDSRAWVLDPSELTPRAATVALKLFPILGVEHPSLHEIRDQMIQNVRPFDNATAFDTRIDAPHIESVLASEGKAFFDFQALDLGYVHAVLREHGGAYIGWERGMGKTLGACALTETLGARSVLAVVPNTSKISVWWEAAHVYLEPLFDRIMVMPNDKDRRLWMLEELTKLKREARSVFLITHYESLDLIGSSKPDGSALKSKRGWDRYGEWDLIISDEVHRIKNIKAKMTKALKRVPTKRKLALSGSIIENHLEELFSPLQWLYPERYRAKWRDWNDRYIDYVEGGYSKLAIGVKPDQLDNLRKELGVFMVYRRKEDELDLPERIDQDLNIDLSPGQRKIYDELVTTCMAKLDSGELVATTDGLPMLIKLRQIATGLDLIGKDVHDSAKIDTAVELIHDNPDEQFVVFSWFKRACQAVADRLDDEALVITGDIPQNKRDGLIAQFHDGTARVLCCTISTMGESQNFQNANNAIFLDRSWNPADNTQAEDRVYRIGQEKKVTITHLIAKDTVDELRVTPTIVNKDALRRLILGG